MKKCGQCTQDFAIADEDRGFYKKINIPEPTLCPDCRHQRRMVFRNERKLYQRVCDITGKKIISAYATDAPVTVCDKDYFFSDKFDPMQYGRDFDFNRPFFEQFHELLKTVPLPSLRVERSENCDYNNDMSDCSNCYLCARTHKCRDMMYAYRGNGSSSCIDCAEAIKSELLYECVECVSCYNSKYLFFCSECSDSAFLIDCRNCMNCFMCSNLRNKQYYILNKPYSKEEYFKKMKEFDFSHYAIVQKAFGMFKTMKQKAIHQAIISVKTEDCMGDNLFESKHCRQCFGVKFSQDCAYLIDVMKYKDSMDSYSGGRDSELCYETTSVSACFNTKFCVRATYSNDIDYSFFIQSSHDCFGCIGLRQKTFCIFNKQYSELEYKALRERIIRHMQKTSEWGEFFPVTMSPFAYNETVAQEYFPLTTEEAQKRSWSWRIEEEKLSDVKKVIPAAKLPDTIKEIPDEVLEWAIACEATGRPFKVTPQELRFYREHQLPMPHLHPDERYRRRLEFKRPHHLYSRPCSKCGTAIQSVYASDRPEIVYCEACYLKEVY
ncbi:MAG: hypothetical protein V1908_03415 [Candidatus Peregrinibacteria bacterium]